MVTIGSQLLRSRISAPLIIGLLLGAFATAGCDRPPSTESSSASSSPSDSGVSGLVFRADPNPVPPGNPKGRTTIIWDTGTDDVGDVYVVSAGDEKLFASARQGSQEAAWIPPGATEFRLYRQEGHALLGKLTVRMAYSDASRNKPSPSP
jgi:hypothetical protein